MELGIDSTKLDSSDKFIEITVVGNLTVRGVDLVGIMDNSGFNSTNNNNRDDATGYWRNTVRIYVPTDNTNESIDANMHYMVASGPDHYDEDMLQFVLKFV